MKPSFYVYADFKSSVLDCLQCGVIICKTAPGEGSDRIGTQPLLSPLSSEKK